MQIEHFCANRKAIKGIYKIYLCKTKENAFEKINIISQSKLKRKLQV